MVVAHLPAADETAETVEVGIEQVELAELKIDADLKRLGDEIVNEVRRSKRWREDALLALKVMSSPDHSGPFARDIGWISEKWARLSLKIGTLKPRKGVRSQTAERKE